MTQKELNYIEDLYNHEKLIMDVLTKEMDCLQEKSYITLFENHLKEHTSLLKQLEKELKGAN